MNEIGAKLYLNFSYTCNFFQFIMCKKKPRKRFKTEVVGDFQFQRFSRFSVSYMSSKQKKSLRKLFPERLLVENY